MKNAVLKSLIGLTIFIFSFNGFSAENIEDTTQYMSQYDESITLNKVTYLPSVDNVNGVYAKAINERLEKLIVANHKWDFVEPPAIGPKIQPDDLINNPQNVLSFSKKLGVDGFFLSELRKDPKETKIHLYLFSAKSGALITEASLKRINHNTEIVQVAINSLMARVVEKVPYDALIVSRTDNRVTINAGKVDGVQMGQNLTAIKIIGAKMHPKRKFIIKSSKVLLGQIRVVKVDDKLSFADIVTETEPGVLTKNVKITGISRVSYESTPWTKQYTPPEQLLSENNKSVFGKDAREWVAKDPPTFGKVGANFGIGSFDNNLTLSNGQSLDSKASTYPRVRIDGEVWITPKIYGDASFAQGIGSGTDPTSGQEISQSLTQYRFSFGYNFILRDEFFGPKLSLDIGFSSYRMFIDTTSNTGYTTMEYRSLPIGIGGYVPINARRTWAIGGKAYFHFFPSLTETPFSSAGESDNTINHFLFYAENKISQRLRWKVGLEFLLLSSSFSGQGGRATPASNSSHRFTLLTTGVDYMF